MVLESRMAGKFGSGDHKRLPSREISKLLKSRGLPDNNLNFFDGSWSTGTVSDTLENSAILILDDSPKKSPVSGSATDASARSDWSKKYKAHILFDKILAKTNARHVLFSYNNDPSQGEEVMSKSFIEASLKRYGTKESYLCKKINQEKYAWGSRQHLGHLFFIEKKDSGQVNYESPLNYTGNKSKILTDIKKNLPDKVDSFIDMFGGGFNVGLNINSNKIMYNDINYFVKEILESFKTLDTHDYILHMKGIIRKFGLKPADAPSYFKARKYYNSRPVDKKDPRLLYTVILYGYQQQMRFNANHDFNNAVGMRWFNDKVLEKMISFSRVLKEKNIVFECLDYISLLKKIPKNAFIYMDPPYMLTTGSYNDGRRGFRGWTKELEGEFLATADELNVKNHKFMISYVLQHKDKVNSQVKKWVRRGGYRLLNLKPIPGINRKEVLILNYQQKNQNHNKK